jgi:hypothetical protein
MKIVDVEEVLVVVMLGSDGPDRRDRVIVPPVV